MTRCTLRFAALTLAFVCGFQTLQAQSAKAVAASTRVTEQVDPSSKVPLAHHVPVYADVTRLPSTPLSPSASFARLTVMLTRAPQVQAAFDQFTAEQVDPSSPHYHQWLTPAQIGELYGPAQSDVDAVTSWLKSEGLTVIDVEPNRLFINFSGPVSSVAHAFSTEFRTFSLANGESRYSIVTEPSVPSAIAPVIGGIVGLSQAIHHPALHTTALGRAGVKLGPDGHTPDYSISSTTSVHFVVAGDFSTQYDMGSVYSSGYNGAGQKIAVIGESRVDQKDVQTLQTIQGQTTKYPNVIIPTTGVDPGYTGGTTLCTTLATTGCPYDDAQAEATLDVQRTLGQAPGATVDLVVSGNVGSGNTVATDGLYIAINYEINTVMDPIMSISFGGCENLNGSTSTNYENTIFQTAAGEGISVFVSSGDSGATSCNAFYSSIPTTQVLSINDLCATSYVTCVGGTEWVDESAISTYWNTSNASDGSSLKTHVPEGAWNDFYDSSSKVYEDAASGGGVSVYIAKPSYQSAVTTFPTTSPYRWVPDLAFDASNGNDFFLICYEYAGYGCVTGSYIGGIGGTSAAAPSMAGIQAVVNQKLGSAQGPINTKLYSLGVAGSNSFYDTTVATSGVTGCTATVASLCNNSTPGSSSTATAAVSGYLLTNGWDAVTGWGSLDVSKYLTALSNSTVSTTLAVTATTNPISAGQTDTFTATLTRSSTTPGAATGTVQFYNNGTAFGSPVTISNNVAVSAAQAFPSTGTYSITAVYSGDTNYTTSTSPAVSLVVNAAPTFNVTPATTSYNLISGVTTGNTDVITFASVNSFAGGVTPTCTVINVSGTAAGTCAMAPGSVTLTSGGTGTSTLTITTTPGTSGVLSVTVTGTNGTTVVNSAAITVNLTASSFTMTAAPLAINITSGATTGNTSTITLTSINGFAGTVTVTCTATKISGTAAGSCAASPSTVTLAANGTGTTTVTLTSTAGTAGVLSLAVSGSGAPTGGTIAATASIPTPITATLVTPSFTMAAPATISLAGNATTGNTVSVTLTSVNGFVGTVTVGCASSLTTLTNCSGGTATLASGGTATATVTVSPVLHNSGSATLTVSGSGTSAGLTTAYTATPITVGATITTVASTTTVVASPTTVVSGSATTLTATVTGVTINGTPTGSVTFFANGSQIAVATLSGTGTATTTYTPTVASTTPVAITATYAGDSGYAASTSAATNVTVTGFSATISSTNTSIMVTSGATTGNTAQFTFTPIGAFTGTVNLTCSVSTGTAVYPPTCVMSPASVALTPGSPQISTLMITTTTPHAINGGPHALLYKTGGAVLAMLVCLMPFRRRRLIRPLMAIIFLMGALTALSGCSGGGAAVLHGSSGTYTVTVTGTSGTATTSATIPLQVN